VKNETANKSASLYQLSTFKIISIITLSKNKKESNFDIFKTLHSLIIFLLMIIILVAYDEN
jgi:hypothetical protein